MNCRPIGRANPPSREIEGGQSGQSLPAAAPRGQAVKAHDLHFVAEVSVSVGEQADDDELEPVEDEVHALDQGVAPGSQATKTYAGARLLVVQPYCASSQPSLRATSPPWTV